MKTGGETFPMDEILVVVISDPDWNFTTNYVQAG
jgi:hypothetical protein